MNGNLLIVHGGGPTAVINSSLYGVIQEAGKYSEIGTVYGALGGTGGVLSGNFYDFSQMQPEMLELLKQTPATIIGTSRKPLEADDYESMIKVFKRHKIKYVLLNGGNGSMDACGKLYRAALKEGITVVGIPKTVDNDLSLTDHCPGFGSAALGSSSRSPSSARKPKKRRSAAALRATVDRANARHSPASVSISSRPASPKRPCSAADASRKSVA